MPVNFKIEDQRKLEFAVRESKRCLDSGYEILSQKWEIAIKEYNEMKTEMEKQKLVLGKTTGIAQVVRKQARLTEIVKPYVLGKIKAMGPISAISCFNEIKVQCSNSEIMNSSDYDIEIYLEMALNELLQAGQIEIEFCGLDTVNFN